MPIEDDNRVCQQASAPSTMTKLVAVLKYVAHQRGVHLDHVLHERFGTEQVEELTQSQLAGLINEMLATEREGDKG